jgi:hypothetical protein
MGVCQRGRWAKTTAADEAADVGQADVEGVILRL